MGRQPVNRLREGKVFVQGTDIMGEEYGASRHTLLQDGFAALPQRSEKLRHDPYVELCFHGGHVRVSRIELRFDQYGDSRVERSPAPDEHHRLVTGIRQKPRVLSKNVLHTPNERRAAIMKKDYFHVCP
jgi:hypothetical protein